MYAKYIKRVLDFIMSLLVVILFSWLYLIIAIAVKIEDPRGTVLFKQDRLGKNGKVYKMYKFRSMKMNSEHTGTGVYSDEKDNRITKVGMFLRKTSLDELPQFFNIIKGDMALIGFRSPLTYHPWPWEEYTEEQRKMFKMRPGITGWAQVNGRRTVEWNHRIELNVWYAEHCTFWLDLKIFFLTIFKVFRNADNENLGETVVSGDNE